MRGETENAGSAPAGWRERAEAVSPLLRYAGGDRGGEAGILAKLFTILPERAGFAVEFGQRKLGSGTVAELIADRGWGALYLDREASEPLERRAASNGGAITLVRESVTPANINDLFERHAVPGDLDCLVIDIDGLDYPVWEAIDERYSPSLVVIEFNAHVAEGVAATIRADGNWVYSRNKDYGASLAALESLAARKGYRLVHVHGCWNLYFVRDEVDLPSELALRSPLSAAELELLTDTESFYDSLCGPRQRPSWFGAAPPDVAMAPWEIVPSPTKTTSVDLEGLEIEVLGEGHDAAWYGRRQAFEEKGSLLYPLIAAAGFASFVDIGANVGLVSILARRSSPQIRNVAVEADPRLVRVMRRNFSRHGLEAAHIVTAVAGAREAPSTRFGLNPSSSLDNRVRMKAWPAVRVPMVRMDRVLRELGVLDGAFLKIDTQGFELHVLRGLEPWLAAGRNWMIKMELAPQWLSSQGTSPARLLGYLLARYEVAELPARIAFGTPGLEALFGTRLNIDEIDDLLAHVVALDRGGRGWIDLLVRPSPDPLS